MIMQQIFSLFTFKTFLGENFGIINARELPTLSFSGSHDERRLCSVPEKFFMIFHGKEAFIMSPFEILMVVLNILIIL